MKRTLFSLGLILLSAGCDTSDDLTVTDNKLPYWEKLGERATDDLNMIVIHATELTDLDEARQYGERVLYETSGTGASGHYYIDRDGTIEQYVPDNRIANHTSGWNKKSLSIELINKGRYPNWYHTDQQVMREAYPAPQIDALIELMVEFKDRYPTIKYIQGHEDLDRRKVPAENDPTRYVERKMDPGNLFPWVNVLDRINLTKQIPPYVFRNDDRPEYKDNVSLEELDNMLNRQDITLIDVRLAEDFALDPILIPGANYKDPENIAQWANTLPKNKKVVLYCVKGAWVSHKAATYLKGEGYDVSTLEGGIRDWKLANNK